MELTGHTLFSWDRNADSGKLKGGGLCIYVHNSWYTNTQTIDTHCSPDLEYLTIKCRPFYLPREFSVVMVTAIYIKPDAIANTALDILHGSISEQQNKHPNAAHIITGDFNHADLKRVHPKFTQHIKCTTRGVNMLDKAYSNIKRLQVNTITTLRPVRPPIHTTYPSIYPPKKEKLKSPQRL